MERFDTFSQYWTTVSSLHQARSGLGVAVVGGMVYAIGGNRKNLGVLNQVIPLVLLFHNFLFFS